jgi:hypothetical protein
MMVAGGKSREERWSLAGATALVTGGSKGIGCVHDQQLNLFDLLDVRP